MTIPASTRKAGPYTGNGVATAFDFAFKVFTKSDVRVIRAVVATGIETDLTLDSDYSVTLNADQDADPGGSITYPLVGSPMAATHTLTAVGSLEIKQATDLPDGGAFSASSVEGALDYQNILIQQLEERSTRAVTVPASSTTNPEDLIADLLVASDAAAASAVAAASSASDASDDKDAAAVSAAAAAASAASTGLPSLAGKTLNLLRVKADESGYETRTPAQTRSDIGATESGANNTITSLTGLSTALSTAQGGTGRITTTLQNFVQLRDEQASGVSGGSSTSGSWQTRTINTEVSDTGNLATLTANQVTLAAGTYEVEGRAPAYASNSHQTRLYNATSATALLYGSTAYNSITGTAQTDSLLVGVITVAAGQALELQHRVGNSQASDGYGVGGTFSVNNIYSEIIFRKIA